MRKTFALLTLGLIAMAASNANAAPNTGITAFAPSGDYTTTSLSIGYDFKAKSAIQVTALGFYDAAVAGEKVYLYDISSSSVVTSVTATGGTSGAFTYLGVTAVTLNTNDTYSIYTYFPTTSVYGTASSESYSSDITLTGIPGYGTDTGYTGGNAPPTTGYTHLLSADFQYNAAVPEPASIALMGLGLAGVALVRRKMAKRSA